MADLAGIDVPGDGLPNDLAIKMARAMIKRDTEFTLEAIDLDLEGLKDKDPFEQVLTLSGDWTQGLFALHDRLWSR
jgi:hypothetical protein